MSTAISIDREKIAGFCRHHHVAKLSLFGSVLRSTFGPHSDVDVLVDLEPGATPGLFELVRMSDELTEILGCHADLRTPEELSPRFRDDVLREAEVQYVHR